MASSFKPQPAYRTWGAVPRKAPLVSLGLGGALELDRGGLTPAMRIRFQDWLTVKVGRRSTAANAVVKAAVTQQQPTPHMGCQ